MIAHFTWLNYFIIIALTLTVYYLIMGIGFYRQEIKSFWNSKSRFWGKSGKPPPVKEIASSLTHNSEPLNETEKTDKFPWQNEELFDKVEQLAEHLKLAISEAHEKGYGHKDLIYLIQLTLKDFSALKGTPFRIGIEHIIESETSKYGSINLSANELEEIWKEV